MTWDPASALQILSRRSPAAAGAALMRGTGGMPANERLVLETIWAHSDWRTGTSAPLRIADIAAACAISERTVYRARANLVRWGFLRVHDSPAPGRPCHYSAPWAQPAANDIPCQSVSRPTSPHTSPHQRPHPSRPLPCYKSPDPPSATSPPLYPPTHPEDTPLASLNGRDGAQALLALGLRPRAALALAAIHDLPTIREAISVAQSRATHSPAAYAERCLRQWQLAPNAGMRQRSADHGAALDAYATQCHAERIRAAATDPALAAINCAGARACRDLLRLSSHDRAALDPAAIVTAAILEARSSCPAPPAPQNHQAPLTTNSPPCPPAAISPAPSPPDVASSSSASSMPAPDRPVLPGPSNACSSSGPWKTPSPPPPPSTPA